MDKQTFSSRVKAMERQLYRVAMSYTANVEDAADAVQEALMRAWARRDTLRNEALFETWLTRVVINECKTLLRKRRRSQPWAAPPEAAQPPDMPGAAGEALFGLPIGYRVPLTLNVLEGYTMREIAAMLHMPINTVKTRVSRAKQMLRMAVKEVEHDV